MKLIDILVEKHFVKKGTEITANYMGISLSGVANVQSTGTFLITSIVRSDLGNIYFNTVSTLDGSKKTVLADNIVMIDGMSPQRYAEVFDVKSDGTAFPIYKKRGRKPKQQIAV